MPTSEVLAGENMSLVTINGATCLRCGIRMTGVYWDGDLEDDRQFPIEIEALDVRAIVPEGCYHCGGQIQVEIDL